MAVSSEFEKYVVDQLGGVGMYIDGAFCANLGADSGRLFLKVKDG